MKNFQRTLLALCIVIAAPHAAAQQNTYNHALTKAAHTTEKSQKPVEDFFAAFGHGDMEGILATFHDNATIVAIREGHGTSGEPYGTYKGKEGVRLFISTLGSIFDTQSFSIEHIIGQGDVAFANGKFVHKVRATGKLHASDWALQCTIEGGKIIQFHFYEDSASLAKANQQ